MRAIDAVQNNRNYFCADITRVLLAALPGRDSDVKIVVELSTRERQVLLLVAEGHTSAQVAKQLHIAETTVEVHRRNIMRKLDLRGIAELTRYAIHIGLITD